MSLERGGGGNALKQCLLNPDRAENIRRCVCIIYDPSRSNQGVLALKALKLTETFMDLYRHNNFVGEKLREKKLSWVDIFEEIPIKVSNSALISSFMTVLEPDSQVVQCDLDRLKLSTAPFMERNLEFLIECMDDLSSEQNKLQYYYRNLSRQQTQQQTWLQKRRTENMARKAAGEEPLPEEDPSNPIFKPIPEPSRLDSYLITNQVSNYCNQINGNHWGIRWRGPSDTVWAKLLRSRSERIGEESAGSAGVRSGCSSGLSDRKERLTGSICSFKRSTWPHTGWIDRQRTRMTGLDRRIDGAYRTIGLCEAVDGGRGEQLRPSSSHSIQVIFSVSMAFSYFSCLTSPVDSDIDAIFFEAPDLCVLEQISAVNIIHLAIADLSTELEFRFRELNFYQGNATVHPSSTLIRRVEHTRYFNPTQEARGSPTGDLINRESKIKACKGDWIIINSRCEKIPVA
ncbi:Eukaryotic translation initiation factor 3 subunit H [Platanthera guangdongensis]|uniref:Eukaryotic translation initiation factor 3 subunit H n=1 Tax=Platanthera guangdongensis TaxID=2320717 RepID=A0ABR2LFN6_9ASPA